MSEKAFCSWCISYDLTDLWRIHLNGITFPGACIGFPGGWNLNLSLDTCKEC
jgi:hypothetical protein